MFANGVCSSNWHSREDIYLAASFQARQKFLVDNTNPSREVRAKYIQLSKTYQYKVIGYFMVPNLENSLLRNQRRQRKERVPIAAIKETLKKLEAPQFEEGFDELYQVTIENSQFVVTKIN